MAGNVSKHFLEILARCQPPLSVPNIKKTMLIAGRVVQINSESFLLIVGSSKNSLLLFLLLNCHGRTCNEGSSTSSVRSALSQAREQMILGRRAVINLVRNLCHREVLCCMFLCEMAPSEQGDGASCQLCMLY